MAGVVKIDGVRDGNELVVAERAAKHHDWFGGQTIVREETRRARHVNRGCTAQGDADVNVGECITSDQLIYHMISLLRHVSNLSCGSCL